MHIEAEIPNGLIGHFDLLALPTSVRVAYPARPFEPDENAFIRLTYSPNEPLISKIGFGKEPIRRGLFQASIFWPESEGIIKPYELAGEIRDHFARGTKIAITGGKIRIDDEPNVTGMIKEESWQQIPIFINWIVYP